MKTQTASFNPMNRLTTRFAYSLTAFALATLLWACGQDSASTPTPKPDSITAAQYQQMRTSFNSLEGDWSLTTYQNAPLPASLQNKAWLRFTKESGDTHKIVGASFVNGYGGTVRLDETKGLIVLAEPIVQTLIGASDELNQAEARHLDGLSKATSYELATNGQLKIYLGDQSSAATEVMVFTKK